MRMANKTNVNANKEAETVEEVKAVDDAPVTEGTDVQVNEEETVPADKKEEVEAAKPKPVSKGNRRGSKALQLELEKAKELAAGNEEKYKRLCRKKKNDKKNGTLCKRSWIFLPKKTKRTRLRRNFWQTAMTPRKHNKLWRTLTTLRYMHKL